MLELAILGLLEDREMHGYEIRRRLRDELGVFSNVSFGSLYPALSRLERSGAVVTADNPDAGQSQLAVPMTGSLSGERAALRSLRAGSSRSRRGKRVYRITENGKKQFVDMLVNDQTGGDEARSFSLRLAFARYLPPQARLRLLERRRAQLVDRLSQSRAAAGSSTRLDRYARSLVEHTTDATEREISWLERLIDGERSSGTLPAVSSTGATHSNTPAFPQSPQSERAEP
jgi:DNA-binding PadR family transcriptional regulator